MKTIRIKAQDFFDLLKLQDVSMWDIFAQMIDGEEKEIIFLNDQEEILFNYTLPSTLEKMQEDKEIFVKEFSEKLKSQN